MNRLLIRLLPLRILLLGGLALTACDRYDVRPRDEEAFRTQIEGMIRDRTRRIAYQPAIAAAVVRNGQVVTRHTYGTRKPFGTEAVTGRTLFPLASSTKLFTSVAVLLAVQEGRLRLDQPISAFVEGLPESWRAITVKHLLTHTDGLKDGFLNPKMGQLPPDQHEALSRMQYVQFAAELPVNFAPGKRTQYGQTGFVLLSMVLERIYGQPYERIVQTKLFTPLGMNETYFTSKSFQRDGFTMDIFEPAGSSFRSLRLGYNYPDYATAAVSSTLDDMIAFARGMQQNRVLTAETFRQLTTPTELSRGFALGWTYDLINGQVAVGHSGGQSVVVTFLPASNATTILLSNTTDPAVLSLGHQLTEKTAQYLR